MTDERSFDLIAAVHTPFGLDGEVDLDVIDAQATHLAESGVNGAFICGTTGEGLSLSIEERKGVAAKWASVTRGSELSLWVHVGANALPEVEELARDAANVGADAIALMPPCFFRPDSEEALVAWCAVAAAAAGGLPLSYYESPQMSGVHLDMERFVHLAREGVRGYRGLKFTDSNLALFSNLCAGAQAGEGMWWGRDEELRGGIAAGATGAIGSTYNFAAPVYEDVLREVTGGSPEAAAASQANAVALIEVIGRYGYLPAAKAVMGMLDIPVGPARLPLTRLGDEGAGQLRADLEQLGFFDWVSA